MVAVAPVKISFPSFGASPRKVTAVRLLYQEKAFSLILVMLSGNVMLVRLLHPEKAYFPMLVTLLPIVTLVRLLHKPKADIPMLVTLSGIVMLVRLLMQGWRALIHPDILGLSVTTLRLIPCGSSF